MGSVINANICSICSLSVHRNAFHVFPSVMVSEDRGGGGRERDGGGYLHLSPINFY